MVVMLFVRSTYLLLGSCSPLSKDCVVVKLHCVGLHQFGERGGVSEQRAFGSFKAEGTFVAQAKGLTQIWLHLVIYRVKGSSSFRQIWLEGCEH